MVFVDPGIAGGDPSDESLGRTDQCSESNVADAKHAISACTHVLGRPGLVRTCRAILRCDKD